MTSLDDRLSQVPIGQIADKSTGHRYEGGIADIARLIAARSDRPRWRGSLVGAGSPLGATKATSGNDLVADAADRDGYPAEQPDSGAYHRRGAATAYILGGLLGSSGKILGIGGAIGEALAGNADGALARTFRRRTRNDHGGGTSGFVRYSTLG